MEEFAKAFGTDNIRGVKILKGRTIKKKSPFIKDQITIEDSKISIQNQ